MNTATFGCACRFTRKDEFSEAMIVPESICGYHAKMRNDDLSSQPHEPPMVKFIPASDKVTDWDKEKVVAGLRDAITRHYQNRIWMWEHTIKAAIDLLSKEAA